MGNVLFENLDEEARSRLPRYPMPVLHVGQLATDKHYQGRGIGSLLLSFAARKAVEASATLGCFAIELIADSPEARAYYLRRGFRPLAENSMRLYQSVDSLKEAARLSNNRREGIEGR
jgi:GNAT superfamily N-acetyltransferase